MGNKRLSQDKTDNFKVSIQLIIKYDLLIKLIFIENGKSKSIVVLWKINVQGKISTL